MKSIISIFEIPTKDFQRAKKFYEAVLNIAIEETEMGETKMGLFPSDGESVSGVLIHSPEYKPSADGVLIYFNGGVDLQPMLDRVEKNKGQVVVPKTEISPEIGYFAMFMDTEGNKLGMHSMG